MEQKFDEGMAKGLAEGRAEGEKLTLTRVANQMLKQGLSVSDVHIATGLSEQEIVSLRRQNSDRFA